MYLFGKLTSRRDKSKRKHEESTRRNMTAPILIWRFSLNFCDCKAGLDISIQQRSGIQRLYIADPAWLWDSLFLRHELEKDWERLYVYLCDFGILNTWLPMPQLKFREHLQIPHQYIYEKQKNVLSLKSSFRSIVFLSRSFSFFLHCRSSILVKMAAATQMVEYFILDKWHSICVELVKFFSCLRLHLWHNKSSVLKLMS